MNTLFHQLFPASVENIEWNRNLDRRMQHAFTPGSRQVAKCSGPGRDPSGKWQVCIELLLTCCSCRFCCMMLLLLLLLFSCAPGFENKVASSNITSFARFSPPGDSFAQWQGRCWVTFFMPAPITIQENKKKKNIFWNRNTTENAQHALVCTS